LKSLKTEYELAVNTYIQAIDGGQLTRLSDVDLLDNPNLIIDLINIENKLGNNYKKLKKNK